MLRSKSILSVAARALSGASLAVLLPVTAASAQESGAAAESTRSFDIPATTLEEALRTYMRQSGVQVSWSGIDGATTRTVVVRGRMSATSALSRLLEGTGITYRFTAPTSAILERAPQAVAGTVQLGTLRVEGAAGGDGRSQTGGMADTDAAHRNFRGPQSVAHRDQAQIAQVRGTSPGDFISGIPGVLNGDNRNSGALDVNIRGMQGMDRVPVVIDGSLQQSTVYRGYAGVAGRTYLDPDLVGSVTIEKGPSAAADGVGAIGGVVRVDTIGARDLIAPDGTFGIQLRGGVTGNNVSPPPVGTPGTGTGTAERFDRPGLLDFKGYNLSGAAAARLGDFELVGAVAVRKVGNYFGGDHGTVPPGGIGILGNVLHRYNLGEEVLSTSQDNTSVLARGTYRFGNGMGVDLSYMRYESDFGEMMPSMIIRFGGALESPLSRTEVDTYTLRYRWKPDDNDLINVRADAWATHNYTSIGTMNIIWGTTEPPQPLDKAYQSVSDRWGINISNTSLINTGLGPVTLNYGMSYQDERIAPPADWEEYKANSNYNFIEPRDGWRKEYSAFIAGEWQPVPWVTFNAALRYTNTLSQDNNDTYLPNSVPLITGKNREHNEGLAPIVSFLVEPIAGLQFYGRYAEAIRAPSLFEATTGFNLYPNPQIPMLPERSRMTEMGINLQQGSLITSGDLLQGKLSYFTNDVEDYLTRGGDLRNIDNAHFQGMEASLRYDAGFVFADVGATLYTKSMFCDDAVCREGGTANSYVPTHLPPRFSLTGNLGFRLLDDRLTVSGRYTHVGKRDATLVTWGGSLTAVNWTPYNLFDLYSSFDLTDTLRLDVAVDNITDRYYMDALTLGLMPSPGRTMRIGLGLKLGGPERSRSRAARISAAEAIGQARISSPFSGDWSGPYAGLHAGYGFLSSKGATTALDGTEGGIPATESADIGANNTWAGAFGGYNATLGGLWVAGVEGSFDISRSQDRQIAMSTELRPSYPCTTLNVCDLRNQADTNYRFNWFGTARGRIGYATGRMLFYGAGGVAFLNETQARTQYVQTADPRNVTATNRYGDGSVPRFTDEVSATRVGWTAGGGVEVALGNRWALRGDYSYSRFGRTDFEFADARAGVGTPYWISRTLNRDPVTGALIRNPETNDFYLYNRLPGTGDIVNGRRARNSAEMHSLRIGVSYRF